jgi:hypothetical protein
MIHLHPLADVVTEAVYGYLAGTDGFLCGGRPCGLEHGVVDGGYYGDGDGSGSFAGHYGPGGRCDYEGHFDGFGDEVGNGNGHGAGFGMPGDTDSQGRGWGNLWDAEVLA